ncbi:MAG: hypothetical protein WC254_00235 [Candidatus Woesearchaeota archaeon]|jgi:hypothetical protein
MTDTQPDPNRTIIVSDEQALRLYEASLLANRKKGLYGAMTSRKGITVLSLLVAGMFWENMNPYNTNSYLDQAISAATCTAGEQSPNLNPQSRSVDSIYHTITEELDSSSIGDKFMFGSEKDGYSLTVEITEKGVPKTGTLKEYSLDPIFQSFCHGYTQMTITEYNHSNYTTRTATLVEPKVYATLFDLIGQGLEAVGLEDQSRYGIYGPDAITLYARNWPQISVDNILDEAGFRVKERSDMQRYVESSFRTKKQREIDEKAQLIKKQTDENYKAHLTGLDEITRTEMTKCNKVYKKDDSTGRTTFEYTTKAGDTASTVASTFKYCNDIEAFYPTKFHILISDVTNKNGKSAPRNLKVGEKLILIPSEPGTKDYAPEDLTVKYAPVQ